jgi:O-antigen/teichoic acid export membrane protein
MEDLETRIVRNALFILCARVWFLVMGLFLTPYILSRLGNDEFGIWLLVGVIVGYVGIADFGLGASFVKFIAEYNARGDQKAVNAVYSTGVAVYLALTFIVLSAAYLSIGVVLEFLTIPPGMEEKARFVVGLGFVALVWTNFILVYRSVIDGLQRIDISTGVAVLSSVANIAGCVIALESGFGIQGLAINQLITHAITTVLTMYLAYRICPGLRFVPKDMRAYFSRLFRYGVNLQIGNVASLINLNFDKLLVNRFIDASHVTFYEIGSRLPWTLRGFPLVVLSPLIPATSELEVREGRAAVYDLFSRTSKYLSVVAFPLFGGAMVTGQAFIEAWVGHGYDSSVIVLRILCVGYFLYTLAAPSSHMVSGMGRPDYPRNAETLNLLVNVVSSVALVSRYGFYGAPLGTAIAMAVAAVYYLWAFHRFIGQPILPFLRTTLLKPALCATIAGLVALGAVSVLFPYTSGSRLGALLVLVAAGFTFVGLYVLLLLKVSYLDDRDFLLLRKHLPFLGS